MKREHLITRPVVLCIGTTNVPGDSLGPKVGDLLTGIYNVDAYVYGKTSHPVTGVNYNSYIAHIKKHHKDCLIIAVDACLGTKKDVGKIKYTTEGLRAGAALNKNLSRIGDIGILGVIGEKGENNLCSLMRADKGLVEKVAEDAARKVSAILAYLRLNYA